MFQIYVLLITVVGIAFRLKHCQYPIHEFDSDYEPLFADRLEAARKADDCYHASMMLLIAFCLLSVITLLEFFNWIRTA